MGQGNRTQVVAIPGESAKLACPIPSELYGTKVSWIRRSDLQLLSVGEAVYSNDNRFFVSHSRHSHYQGSRHSQVWFLHLLNVTDGDEGEYECQTSNHPHVSTITFLKVQSAYSVILGPAERVVAARSQLRLVCSIKNSSEELLYLFWYRGSKMVNYDSSEGVRVETGKDFSTLTISAIEPLQAGNYTCEPSNASPSSVIVHVVEELSKIGAYQPGTRKGYSSEGGKSPGRRVGAANEDDKASVRQLGVKSASSAGPKAFSHSFLSSFFAVFVCLFVVAKKKL